MSDPCRIYAPDNDLYALVDEIDYAWAAQWRWSPKWSRGGTKVYLRRVAHHTAAPDVYDEDGRRIRFRVQQTVWLHREIVIRRLCIPPPSPLHVLVDHENGDELDCRRENLRWATHSDNVRNRRVNGATMRRRLGL